MIGPQGYCPHGWEHLLDCDKCRNDINIEGTDVEALNEIFGGDAGRFRDYLLAKIKAQEKSS